jgi:hypothetical protein
MKPKKEAFSAHRRLAGLWGDRKGDYYDQMYQTVFVDGVPGGDSPVDEWMLGEWC